MIEKDLVAASSTVLVLSILADSESYGYEVIRRVSDLSRGQMSWSDGMLYPVLHRLESKGFVHSEWRQAETGRQRKYYTITRTGRRELRRLRADWTLVNTSLVKLWEMIHV